MDSQKEIDHNGSKVKQANIHNYKPYKYYNIKNFFFRLFFLSNW